MSTHYNLAVAVDEVMTNHAKAPEWLTEGIIHLLLKTEQNTNSPNSPYINY